MTMPATLYTAAYANLMYEDAGKRYQDARRGLVKYALLTIALTIRDEFPTATHLLAGISDQGPYLTPDVIVDPDFSDDDGQGFDDNEIEEDHWEEIRDHLWGPISDLDDEDPFGLWQPFVTVNPDPPAVGYARAACDPTGRYHSYALDLDLIIFCEGDAKVAIALAEQEVAK